jgi:hypothetical protein
MSKKSPFIIAVILLWLASLACGQTANVPTLDPNAAQTAIVETMSAIQAQATPSEVPLNNTPTLDITTTPPPSPTVEPTGTPTTPQISVSVATFCRLGPGAAYEKVGILLVGETTEIVGRDAMGQYWYVRNPDVGVDFCWMSGEYATISGNYAILLVHTPPGALTDFEATYQGQGQCSGSFWSDIRLKNLGGAWFKSLSITVRDTDTNTVRTATANNFAFNDGCSAPRITDILIQGSNVLISSPEFPYNLNAHAMSATIILCTELNQSGGCVTKTITYKP